MKLFGHPIHIMLIHFPSALFPMDVFCSLAQYFTDEPSFTYASFYAMAIGTMLGWLAVIFGTFDLLKIFEKKPDAMKSALVHGGVNILVILAYTFLTYIAYKNYPFLKNDTLTIILIKAFTVGLMIIGNFIGANLILKHKIAIENE